MDHFKMQLLKKSEEYNLKISIYAKNDFFCKSLANFNVFWPRYTMKIFQLGEPI